MAGRDECVSGCLGKDPEELFGINNERYARFTLCVDGYKEGKLWYDVKAKGNLADFVLDNLVKGTRCLVRGVTTARDYFYKGEQRTERTLRATKVTLNGGDECELLEIEEETPTQTEADKQRQRLADLEKYPHRWNVGKPAPVVRDEDLEVTPHDEAADRLRDIVRSLEGAM